MQRGRFVCKLLTIALNNGKKCVKAKNAIFCPVLFTVVKAEA